MRTSEAIPAVVVGAGLNGLGVVRSLAAGAMPIHLIGCVGDVGLHTRHASVHRVSDTAGDALMAALTQVRERMVPGTRPVLFLTEEKTVRTVSERRADILPNFRIALPDASTLAALMDKSAFQALAEASGAHIPRAVSISTQPDLERLAQLRYPAVLKPAYKHYGYGALFQKAYVVDSACEAAARWREVASVLPDMIVQQWIAGSDSDIYFCLQYVGANGHTPASFVGRKLRCWPLRVGGTASCIAAPEFAAQLSAATSAFFHTVGFVGMGSMEYKRDTRDGRFYMIEPTVARTDFQEEVATLNGINIPLAAYLHEIGAPRQPRVPTSVPRLWREPQTERWAREADPQTTPEQDACPHVTRDAYFRVTDPMPALAFLWERVCERWRLWMRAAPSRSAP